MPLRLRDRSQFGREIDCPDCGSRLRIVTDAGQVRAVRAKVLPGLELPRQPGSKETLRLIWLATACLGAVIVWLAVRPTQEPAVVEPSAFVETSVDVPAPAPVPDPVPEVVVPEPAVVAAPKPSPMPEPLIVEPSPMLVVAVDDRPINPDFAPEPPPVDIPAQLSLRIAGYSQPKPVQARLLLRQIAELSAVAIDLSEVEVEPWQARLELNITLDLKETTVRGVLEEILKRAGLGSRHGEGVIYITPSANAGA